MKIENQVVSLELAKKLKEAGYPQEGFWFWRFATVNKKHPKYRLCYGKKLDAYKNYVAPTVAELGCKLPSYIKAGGYDIERIKTERNGGHFTCYFRLMSSSMEEVVEFESPKEADARALMWLELKKRELL